MQSIAKQSNYASSTQAEHADSDNPSTFEDLPRITIYTREGRKQYIDARLLNNRIKRRSWIWLHRHNLVEVGTKKPYWACSLCDAKNKSNGIYSAQSTSGPERHLQIDHSIRRLKRNKSDMVDDDKDLEAESIQTSSAGSSVYDMLRSGARSLQSCLPKDLVGRFKRALIL